MDFFCVYVLRRYSCLYVKEITLFSVCFIATVLKDPGLFTCKSRADISFVIDSPSRTEAGFEKEKQFIKAVARAFDVFDTGVHLSIVPLRVGTSGHVRYIHTNNGTDFFKAVNNLRFLGKSKKIDEALSVAYNGLISPSRGRRFDAPQTLILLTDGINNEDGTKKASLSHAVSPFHETGIKVVVAAVASNAKRTDLEKLVKAKEDIFVAENLDGLVSDEFTNLVAAAACQPGNMQYTVK